MEAIGGPSILVGFALKPQTLWAQIMGPHHLPPKTSVGYLGSNEVLLNVDKSSI